jgi:precorrin-3B C17-methyltransferase
VTGWLKVVGLGPGDPRLVTPEATEALAGASDLYGYGPYVARIPPRPGLTVHASDNREEIDRARAALACAAAGGRVAVVSSGDPGVFAMAAAVFEALEGGPPGWRALDIAVLPGITAMLAAAARAGAPLGHDFCAINLSDNLKPAALIEARIRAAAGAGFAMAFYNPASRARPDGFARALGVLREALPGRVPLIFARAVATPEERIETVPLGQAAPGMADMRTVVIVGTAETRVIAREGRAAFVYTPRFTAGSIR